MKSMFSCLLVTALSLTVTQTLPAQGSYSLTLTGEEPRAIEGPAVVYPLSIAGVRTVPRIVLYDLRSDEDYFLVHLQPVSGVMPDPGKYPASPFGGEGFLIAAAEFTGGMPWLMSHETTGTVTIQEATDGMVRGSFLLSEPNDGMSLRGTFHAMAVAVDGVPEPVR